MKTKLPLLVILTTLLCLPPLAHATTRTWSGAGPVNFWTNAANWGGTAPVAGDDLVFADFGEGMAKLEMMME